jgi:catechol 2,3-dioxygenase-like lactoylglutathione lyase family enzyme
MRFVQARAKRRRSALDSPDQPHGSRIEVGTFAVPLCQYLIDSILHLSMLRHLTGAFLLLYLEVEMISIKIKSLDHIVLNVSDAERSLAFYAGTLGLRPERIDEFRSGRVPFPSVRIDARTIVDFLDPVHRDAALASRNLSHIAFAVENTPLEIAEFLKQRGVPIEREMTGNFGAQGDTAHSFHVSDPDGNLLELQAYE